MNPSYYSVYTEYALHLQIPCHRNSRFECARSHELRDQHNALPAFGGSFPGVIKANNVGML